MRRHPRNPAVPQRPTLAVVTVATVVLTSLAGNVETAAAEPAPVRTFDSEPVGVPPADAVTRGAVTVAAAPFGDTGNRAVRVRDTSTTADSSVLFPAPAAPARRFQFDLAPSTTFPVQLIVHGVDAAGADVPAYRMTVAPLYNWGRSSLGAVSIVNGGQQQQWGAIPDLTDQNAPTALSLTASKDGIVLASGRFSFFSTARPTAAAGLVSITGLEIASSGVSATGSEVYLDNLAASTDVGAGELRPGPKLVNLVTELTVGQRPGLQAAATITEPGLSRADVRAQVHVGGRWVPGVVTGDPGALTVQSWLTESDIGLQPVTVTVTDLRTGLVRSVQNRTQVYAPYPTSTVASESGPGAPRFVDAVRTRSGRIVLVYHYADGHGGANGAIRMVSSDDEGKTWTAPITVVSNEYDNRDPKIAELRDGTLLLTSFRTDWANGGRNVGTFVFRSTDGGKTFGEETRIEGAYPGTYSHGPAVQLANGDVLQPLYGGGARVARSTDGGRTFKAENEVTVARDSATIGYREPNITVLPSGELVMLIRVYYASVNAERQSKLSRSFDGGRTWTAPEDTDLPTSSHHQLLTRDGSVLLTYGNILQPWRPTYAALITNPSGSWSGYRSVPVYNSGAADDQGNPTSVQLGDGSFLSFGYDIADRTVVSWRTTVGTYR
ncbi:sialidase family protein [Nakamurella aerolata]|uniref:exo-alpha-sialidase n=1 Tax=Nakamurella aerolata TaxID=1656892 RepID=A0A849ABP8_9ACTN|nr:sialidase family protein [Nakamurella aerolata]NNG34322.1 exo-alpha-sialidase [Nakamurella aerolata]